mmetsp:Transcript_53856/g.155501  ORF Transcript_53856/g.155501 Transcript_53856/m.155501 type:complete len:229 (+) Transcript_53856:1032-1718(+)
MRALASPATRAASAALAALALRTAAAASALSFVDAGVGRPPRTATSTRRRPLSSYRLSPALQGTTQLAQLLLRQVVLRGRAVASGALVLLLLFVIHAAALELQQDLVRVNAQVHRLEGPLGRTRRHRRLVIFLFFLRTRRQDFFTLILGRCKHVCLGAICAATAGGVVGCAETVAGPTAAAAAFVSLLLGSRRRRQRQGRLGLGGFRLHVIVRVGSALADTRRCGARA